MLDYDESNTAPLLAGIMHRVEGERVLVQVRSRKLIGSCSSMTGNISMDLSQDEEYYQISAHIENQLYVEIGFDLNDVLGKFFDRVVRRYVN